MSVLYGNKSFAIPTPVTDVSPVTLSSDWSKVARLLLLTAMSVTGCVGNVFMISALMIEDHLKKRGNSFLVNIALADILITGIVIPSSTVVILADISDSYTVCHVQWFLALLSCLVSLLTISVIALENYFRLFLPPDRYDCITPCRITIVIVFIWVASCVAVTIQTVLDLGPDYCSHMTRSPLLTAPYQLTIATLFVLVPAFVTCSCYSLIACRVRGMHTNSTSRPPATFTIDYELMKSNLYSFIVFVIFWLPFGVTLAVYPIRTISLRLFYNLAWFALSKSCIHNLLYCVTNRHFRNAYINLFHYCCCKTSVSFSRRQREPAGLRPTGDVRVHIIPGYNMYSYTSPQRAGRGEVSKSNRRMGSSCRPAQSRPNGREVYEL